MRQAGVMRGFSYSSHSVRHAGAALRSARLEKRAVAQLVVGGAQLLFGVHHDRSIPSDGLLDRPPRDEEKPDSCFSGLHRDLIAAVEQHERAIPRLLHRWAGGLSGPCADPLGEDAPWCRGIAEAAAPLEHIGEGVA